MSSNRHKCGENHTATFCDVCHICIRQCDCLAKSKNYEYETCPVCKEINKPKEDIPDIEDIEDIPDIPDLDEYPWGCP